jgi:hypothetical protein
MLANLFQGALNLFTGRRDRDHSENFSRSMYNLQRKHFLEDRKYEEGALNRLVNSARNAGISPLAAMGLPMQSTSFSPSTASSSSPASNFNLDTSASDVNKAQVRYLDAQTDFVRTQADASKVAMLKHATTVNKDNFHDLKDPTRLTRLRALGMDVDTSSMSDAEVLEQRYGELGGSILGLGNVPADAFTTAKNRIKKGSSIARKIMREYYNWLFNRK